MSKSKKSSRRRIVALAAATLIAVSFYAAAKRKALSQVADIKPTVLTCLTPLGAFQVNNEQAKILLQNGRYVISNDEQEVSVSETACVTQRAK